MSKRQTVTFTDAQAEYLEREATRIGITVSDLIRRIIDQYRDNAPKESVKGMRS
jgi:hypothetical protein